MITSFLTKKKRNSRNPYQFKIVKEDIKIKKVLINQIIVVVKDYKNNAKKNF
jgi:hypothetical protein